MKQRFTKRTRLVSALLTLAMVFTFLPFSAFAADYYSLNTSSHFPDAAFREYLKKKFDTDHDEWLSSADLNDITEIDVHEKNITSLKGIELFPNLKKLDCHTNQLTELDVSKNTALTYLDCSENNLSSLDVSNNTKLVRLDCHGNDLSSLNVRQNAALTYLDCGTNQLTSLDVRQNAALKYLYCSQNNLTSLDVSQNPALGWLNCKGNQLTSLDLSQTAVVALGTSDNKITIEVEETSRTFDLSTLPGKFDVTKATNWNGGTVKDNILTVDEKANQVTYTYDCGKVFSRDFTLNVNVVPDGTVTPPSGGGSTGGGSTGGGSTGGGSTGGGSTGGGSTGGTTIPPEAGKYQLTVTDGVATVNGITRDVLNVKPGDTETLTADTTKFPENEEFGWWEITPYGSVSNTLTGQYQRTATFKMPNENVSARAMSKSAGVSTGGDDGGGGGGAAILLVGGAAVAGLVGYGVYSYVSEQQLKALLPEGVAMPENRAQTALLLWNTAGRPEPAEAPAFKDVADPDTAKAAQWCVEHGLMDQKLGGRFAPDNSDPAYKTLNAYQQLVG